jgi:hypothetical protein
MLRVAIIMVIHRTSVVEEVSYKMMMEYPITVSTAVLRPVGNRADLSHIRCVGLCNG